jgi:hypothetical protein
MAYVLIMLKKLGQGHFLSSPIIMNVIDIPFFHSLNTVKVYKRYCTKKMEPTLTNNVVKHFIFVAFQYAIK